MFTGSQRMSRQRLRIDRVLSRALVEPRGALREDRIDVVRQQDDPTLPHFRRSPAPAAGIAQHPDQRGARDRRQPASLVAFTRQSRRRTTERPWSLDDRRLGPGIPHGGAPADLRSVLHDEGSRTGHGPRAGDHLRNRAGARRHDSRDERARRRRDASRSSSPRLRSSTAARERPRCR